MVMCLGQGTDLYLAQLMPVPLTISCSSKSRLVLPFWCLLTRVVSDKIQEGHKMVVCVLKEQLCYKQQLDTVWHSAGVFSSTEPCKKLNKKLSRWHRPLQIRTDDGHARVCELGSIAVLVVLV